jgi:hypothetical protein
MEDTVQEAREAGKRAAEKPSRRDRLARRRGLQRELQGLGMNRFDARRFIYGRTLRQSIAPGRGVNRARPKAREGTGNQASAA